MSNMTEFILNPDDKEKNKNKIENQFNQYQYKSKKMDNMDSHYYKEEDQFINKLMRDRSASEVNNGGRNKASKPKNSRM